MTKRLLSVLLCLLMLFTMLPSAALTASAATVTYEAELVKADGTVKSYEKVWDALTDARQNYGCTVRLLQTCTVTFYNYNDVVSLTGGVFTLDIGAYGLHFEKPSSRLYPFRTSTPLIIDGADVTIIGGTDTTGEYRGQLGELDVQKGSLTLRTTDPVGAKGFHVSKVTTRGNLADVFAEDAVPVNSSGEIPDIFKEKNTAISVGIGDFYVVSHPSHKVTAEDETVCTECGRSLEALYVGKSSRYFSTLTRALEAAGTSTEEDSVVIRLLRDATAKSNYWAEKRTLTLNTDGHTVSKLTLRDGADITLSGKGVVNSVIVRDGSLKTSPTSLFNIVALTVESNLAHVALTKGTVVGSVDTKDTGILAVDLLAKDQLLAYQGEDNVIVDGYVTAIKTPVTVVQHTHAYDEKGHCACGYTCTDHDWHRKDGKCAICGVACEHPAFDKDTGACTTCGKQLYVARRNDGQYFETLPDAFTGVDTATVTLLCDVSLSKKVIVSTGTFTLDFNGHAITCAQYIFSPIECATGGSLTLTDSVGGGGVDPTGSNSSQRKHSVYINGGNVTVTGGTYRKGLSRSLYMTGGSLTVTGGVADVYATGGTLTITGGTFGEADIEIGTVSLSGGTFQKMTRFYYGSSANSKPLYDLVADGYALQYINGDPVTDRTTGELYNVTVVKHDGHTWSDGVCTNCGLACSHDLDKTDPETGMCSVCGKQVYVARWNENDRLFKTLPEAFDAIGSYTVKLLCDVTLTEPLAIDEGTFTLDLYGHTIEPDGDYDALICSGGSLTITDSNLFGGGKIVSKGYAVRHTGGSLSLVGGDFEGLVTSMCGSRLRISDAIFRKAVNIYDASADAPVLTGGRFYDTLRCVNLPLYSLVVDGFAFQDLNTRASIINRDTKTLECVRVVPHNTHTWSDGICTECGLPCTHDWSAADGVCAICGLSCAHQFDSDTCAVCGMAAQVAIIRDAMTEYVDTLPNAVRKAVVEDHKAYAGCTIRLLTDVTIGEMINIYRGTLSIDLNGHNITSTLSNYEPLFAIETAVESNVFDVSFVNSSAQRATIQNDYTVIWAHHPSADSGSKLTIDGDITLRHKDSSFSTLSVGNVAVTVRGDCEISSLIVKEHGKESIRLFGGEYGEVWADPDTGTLADLLPKGYFYAYINAADGVGVIDATGETELKNVRVIPHGEGHVFDPANDFTCLCGVQAQATLTAADGTTVTPYESLRDAVAAAESQADCTVTMLQDVDLGSEELKIGSKNDMNVAFTFDLGGHTLSGNYTWVLRFTYASDSRTDVTVKNGAVHNQTNSKYSSGIAVILGGAPTHVDFENVTFITDVPEVFNKPVALQISNRATATLRECTVTDRLSVSNGGSVTIESGSYGTLEVDKSSGYSGIASATLYGGEYDKITVTEGTVGELLAADHAYVAKDNPVGVIDVTNKTELENVRVIPHSPGHDFDPANDYTCPCGVAAQATLTAADGATVTGYALLSDAVTAAMAQPGCTVTMLRDVDLGDDRLYIRLKDAAVAFTLDLSGHTLSGSYDTLVYFTDYTPFNYNSRTDVTVKNGTIENRNTYGSSAAEIAGKQTQVTLENVTLIVQTILPGNPMVLHIFNTATATLRGCKITDELHIQQGANVKIESGQYGTLVVDKTDGGFFGIASATLYGGEYDKITVTEGTVGELLAADHAYVAKDDPIGVIDVTNKTELENVRVIPHSDGHDFDSANDYTCPCGVAAQATITAADGATVTGYALLSDAVDAAKKQTDCTVTLLRDVDLGGAMLKIENTRLFEYSFTLDLGGHTLSSASDDAVIHFGIGGEVLVKNGAVHNTKTDAGARPVDAAAFRMNGGKTTLVNITAIGGTNESNHLQKGALYAMTNANLTVVSGDYTGGLYIQYLSGSNVQLLGGTFHRCSADGSAVATYTIYRSDSFNKVSVSDLLGEGCSYTDGDGNAISVDANTTSLDNDVVNVARRAFKVASRGNADAFYDTLDEAIAAAQQSEGCTLELLRDYKIEADATIESGTFDFDLGGYYTLSAYDGTHPLTIAGGNIIMKNGTFTAESTLDVLQITGGEVTLQDLTLRNLGEQEGMSAASRGLAIWDEDEKPVVTLRSVNIVGGPRQGGGQGAAVECSGDVELTVESGDFTGGFLVSDYNAYKPTVVLLDGTFRRGESNYTILKRGSNTRLFHSSLALLGENRLYADGDGNILPVLDTTTMITDDVITVRKATETSLLGTALTLGADLTVNYYAVLSETQKAAQLHAVRGTAEQVIDGELLGGAVYRFAFTGVNPQCMGDTIAAQLMIGDSVLAEKADFSVKGYCEQLKVLYPDDEGLADLLDALLRYGAAAQVYQGYKTDALADADLGDAPAYSPLEEEDCVKELTPHYEVEGVGFTSCSLWFANDNRLIFRFKAPDPAKVKIILYDEDSEDGYTLSSEDFIDCGDGTFAIQTTGLTPLDFASYYWIELYYGDESDDPVQELVYNVNSYLFAKQDQTDKNGELTNMAKLAQTLHTYAEAAYAYTYSSVYY